MFNLKQTLKRKLKNFVTPIVRELVDAQLQSKNKNIQFVGHGKPKFTLGDESYINGLTIYCWDDRISVSIGKYCSIADEVMFVAGGEHDTDWVTTFPFIDRWKLDSLNQLKKPRFKGNIEIGHDVWIGNRATVLSGVSIGHGAVIGACAVVTKNVPPYAIVGGNPARVIRSRFAPEQVEQLLKISWWDWDKDKIVKHASELTNVGSFIEKHGA